MTRALALIDRIGFWGAAAAAAALGVLAVLAFAEVIARSFLAYSIPVALEYNTYLLAIVMFGGSGWALRTGAHIRVELLARMAAHPIRRGIDIAATATGVLVTAAMALAAARMMLESVRAGTVSYYPSETPIAIPQAAFVLSLAVLALAMLARLVRILRGEPAEGSAGEPGHRDQV